VRWDAFEEACPEIATMARERFLNDDLVLVGTLRADGSPRISPNEPDFAAGRLFVSMMWRSRKAFDVLRDPRVIVHSVPSDRMNPGGDVKLYGRIVDERDASVRQAFRDSIRARIDWAPDEPNFHCFSLDVEEAGYIRFGEEPTVLAWDPERGLRELPHPG
jgi:hypothetical protein